MDSNGMLLDIRSVGTGIGVRLDNGSGLRGAKLVGGIVDDDANCRLVSGDVRHKTLFDMDDGDEDVSGDKVDELIV